MHLPKFIQISTLASYPAVLLNRDDSGLAKRMPFGGATRIRVSSQCLKRHWSKADDAFSLTKAGEGLALAVRSRETFSRRLAEPLVADHPKEVVDAVLAAFQADLFGKKEKGSDADGDDKKDKKNAKKADADPNKRSEVVVLGEPEILFMLELAREVCAKAGKSADTAKKEAEKLLKNKIDQFKALKYGAGLDAAMFGRFLSGEPAARVTSAVSVAHSLTVHEEASETDYFSAVDDLTKDESAGSGHLGATELTSGLYYNYVVIDVPGLLENLGEGPRKDWLTTSPDSRAVAARLIRHFIHLICTVSPGAKLGSTAPFAWADFVLVELGERQPRTLANAFLDPVTLRGPDLLGRTIQAMTDHVASLDSMYGVGETRLFASRTPGVAIPQGTAKTLPELAEAVERMILSAGQPS